jgi:SHS2 domain-containing protein
MTTAGYEIFDHPADIGVRARGPDPSAAFAEAAFGMFAVVLGEDPRTWDGEGEAAATEVRVGGADWRELLVNWLAELLFYFDVEAFVPRAIAFERCQPPDCAARLEGIRMQNPDDAAGVAVKAITYHQLDVEAGEAGTTLQVIVDI